MKRSMLWFSVFIVSVVGVLLLVGMATVHIDPFFHYHKPRINDYYYPLDNERSQNNGIIRHFNYEGIITGTSMTQNFKTSEAEAIWGCRFIKTCFSGGTFKEINDNVSAALQKNPNLDIVIRGIDMNKFFDDKDLIRTDLGDYPEYLYDDNALNDVRYIYNRDVVFSRVYPMIKAKREPGFTSGITSFDEYSNWMNQFTFGKKTLYPQGVHYSNSGIGEFEELTKEDEQTIVENIHQNITSLAAEYPHVNFYCFFPPYSAQWWQTRVEKGSVLAQIQAERVVIEELLNYPNIKLFSLNNQTSITTDLNNYKDDIHYGEWINSLILRYMFEGKCQITAENYKEYLDEELHFYTTYDYNLMNDQEDYDNDYYAAFLIVEETYGITGKELQLSSQSMSLSHARIIEDQYEGSPGVLCEGSLDRDYHIKEVTIADFLRDTGYIGCKIEIEDIGPIKFIEFYGKKVADHGQPTVCIYDQDGKLIQQYQKSYRDIDYQWSQNVISVSNLEGKVSVIFHGGYTDSTGSSESQYIFSRIMTY